jgi:hypothetical protein
MEKVKYHYWSHYEAFYNCPQKYLYQYGHKEIDLGLGLGKPLPRKKSSEHHAIMGTAIAAAVEEFYEKSLWKDPKTAREKTIAVAVEALHRELAKPRTFMEWDTEKTGQWWLSPPVEDLERQLRESTNNFVEIVKEEKLLGGFMRSEMDLKAMLGNIPLAGRPDLVIENDRLGLAVIDGKNSGTVGRYTNPDQLRWYAIVYEQVHRVRPQRLFFTYFRFPPGSKVPKYNVWTGLVEVDASEDTIQALKVEIEGFQQAIHEKRFTATPAYGTCRFCDFHDVCPASKYTEQKNSEVLSEGHGFGLVELKW